MLKHLFLLALVNIFILNNLKLSDTSWPKETITVYAL